MLVPVSMYKAEKYAVDMHVLDEKTRTFFLRNFGCARKVYNLYVDYLYNALEKEGYVSGNSIPKISFPVSESVFKKTYPYLKEADSLGLMNARLSFETALKKYLENSDHVTYTKRARRRSESGVESLTFRGLKGMPKFHSKAHGDFSYKTNCQYPNEKNGLKKPTVRLEGNVLYVPKLKDGVRLIIHRKLPKDSRIGNVTFSMDTDGRIFASVEYRYSLKMEMDIRKAVLSKDRTIVDKLSFLGLDYSQQNFYVDSEGRKANYPHWYRKSEAKIIRLQRELSHMEKGSSNYGKQLKKIERLHIKIRNQRLDFVRKEAARLASSYDVIAVENIDLRAMGQTLRLSKNLHDNGFGMFRNILSRKLEEKGSVLVKVDRFFASTKSCSCCGEKSQDVVLGVKEWVCPVCGTYHDRDVNAAINIREEAKRIFPEYFFDRLTEDAKAHQKEEAVKKVVSDLLVGNGYTVQILQCLGGFPKGQTKVHMHGQAQSHDVGVEGPELQGRGVIRKGTQIDLKEVDSEFPVDVVEFIEILGLVRIIRMDLLETVEVVGTLLVHAFVNDEELTALDRNKGVAAEGTAEDHVLFYRVGIGKETVTTDLAEKLTFVAVVFVEVDHGSAAARTADILRNVAGLTTVDRLKILAILPAVVL